MSSNQLIAAAIRGDLTEVKSQISAGSNINLKDNNGQTALMHAAYKGNVAIVKLLLENNADPNIKDKDNWTAFRYAEEFDKTDVAELLKDVTFTAPKENNQFTKSDELLSTNATNTNIASEIRYPANKRDWRDSVIVGSSIGAAILIGLLVTRSPSPTVSFSNNDSKSIQRRNTNSNSQNNVSTTFNQQQAVNLLKNWQRAKRKIFASPYNLSLASEILTSKVYGEKKGSVDWLRNNQHFYTYQTQNIENISDFKLYGNTAILEATVSEQRTLCYKNRKGQIKISNDNNTVFDRSLDRYYFELERGKWKIADYNTIQSIQKSPNSSRTCRIVY